MANVNRFLSDVSIDRAAMIRLFEEDLNNTIRTLINTHADELDELIRTNTLTTAARRQLNNRIRSNVTKTYRSIHASVRKSLRDVIAMEVASGSDTLQRRIDKIFKVRNPQVSAVVKAVDASLRSPGNSPFVTGGSLGANFNKVARKELSRINSIVNAGVANGDSTARIARDVKRTIRISTHQAETLVRTSITTSTNTSQIALYRANKDVLRGYQFVATLDARTTNICGSLDGRVFNIDSGYQPRPPQHWNCRSTTVPVVMDFDSLNKARVGNDRFKQAGFADPTARIRASYNGQAAPKLDYGSWLLTQSYSVQLRHLGSAARTDLFREGNLPLRKFSSGGRFLPINQLMRISHRLDLDRSEGMTLLNVLCVNPCVKTAELAKAGEKISELTNPAQLLTDANLRNNLTVFLGVEQTRGLLGLANYVGRSISSRAANRVNQRFVFKDDKPVRVGLKFPDANALFFQKQALRNRVGFNADEIATIERLARRVAGENINVEAVTIRALADTFDDFKNNAKFKEFFIENSANAIRSQIAQGRSTTGLRADVGALFRVEEFSTFKLFDDFLDNGKLANKNLGEARISEIVKEAQNAYEEINTFNYARYENLIFNNLNLDSNQISAAVRDGVLNNASLRADITRTVIREITNPFDRDATIVANKIGNLLYRRLDPENLDGKFNAVAGEAILRNLERNGLYRFTYAELGAARPLNAAKHKGANYDVKSDTEFGGASWASDRQFIFETAEDGLEETAARSLARAAVTLRNNRQIVSIFEEIPSKTNVKFKYNPNGEIQFTFPNRKSYTLEKFRGRTSGSREIIDLEDLRFQEKASGVTFQLDQTTVDLAIKIRGFNPVKGGPNGLRDLYEKRSVVEVKKLIYARELNEDTFHFLTRVQENGRLHYVGPNSPTGGGISRAFLNTGKQGVINSQEAYDLQLNYWKQFIGSRVDGNVNTRAGWAMLVTDKQLDDAANVLDRLNKATKKSTINDNVNIILNDKRFAFYRKIKPEEQPEILRVLTEWKRLRDSVRDRAGRFVTNINRTLGNKPYRTQLFLGEDGVSSGFQIQSLSTNSPLLGGRTGVVSIAGETNVKRSLYRQIAREVVTDPRLADFGIDFEPGDLFKAIKGLQTVAVYGAGNKTIQKKITAGLRETFQKLVDAGDVQNIQRLRGLEVIVGPSDLDDFRDNVKRARAALFKRVDRAKRRIEVNKPGTDIARLQESIDVAEREIADLAMFRNTITDSFKYQSDNIAEEILKNNKFSTNALDDFLEPLSKVNNGYFGPAQVRQLVMIISEHTTRIVGDFQTYNTLYGFLGRQAARSGRLRTVKRQVGTKLVDTEIRDTRLPFWTYDGKRVYIDYAEEKIDDIDYTFDGLRVKQKLYVTNDATIDTDRALRGYGVNGTHANDAAVTRNFNRITEDTATVFDEFAGNSVDLLRNRQALRQVYSEFADADAIRINIEMLGKNGYLLPGSAPGKYRIAVPRGIAARYKLLRQGDFERVPSPNLTSTGKVQYDYLVDVEELFYRANLITRRDATTGKLRFFDLKDENGNLVEPFTGEDVLRGPIEDWYGVSF